MVRYLAYDIAQIGKSSPVEYGLVACAAASASEGGLGPQDSVPLRQDDGSLVEGMVALAFHEHAPDFRRLDRRGFQVGIARSKRCLYTLPR
jgi:hypothetical protein